MAKKYLDDTGMSYFWGKLKAYFQEKLVSGTNIKTINNESVLGSGDIQVSFDSWHVKQVTPVSSHSFKGTVANAWEYIGASFTVPAGHIYVVQLQTNFASGKPLGIGLNSSTSISSAYGFPDLTCCESANGCNRGTAVLSGGTNGMTYYVFCKRAAVPSTANIHTVAGLDIYQ